MAQAFCGAADPGTVQNGGAKPMSVQMPVVLNCMRHELKAPRLRTWNEVVLVGRGRSNGQ